MPSEDFVDVTLAIDDTYMGMMLEVMMVHHSNGGGPPGDQVSIHGG